MDKQHDSPTPSSTDTAGKLKRTRKANVAMKDWDTRLDKEDYEYPPMLEAGIYRIIDSPNGSNDGNDDDETRSMADVRSISTVGSNRPHGRY